MTNGDSEKGISLKTYFDTRITGILQLIKEKDKNYNQRFDNVIEATKNALAAADRAVTKAETATEKRFEGVNEFRNTLSDQQRTFIPRAESDITTKGLTERISKLEDAQLLSAGKGTGVTQGWGWAVGVIGIVIAILTIVFKFID